MDAIFYWDPTDVQLARRFCQVIQIDSTFKDNVWKFPLLEITATTNEMNAFLIAQTLISSESGELLLWVFEPVYLLLKSHWQFCLMSVYLIKEDLLHLQY
jgi:MULE transposase domain